ncbi:tetratricopeptide repeat protein [Roseateles cellulosilyticus]|uniref:Tetratricopeptide repeat protein n=1 Tax=Pelomonas cellulosilytica TaxID=2906762 RepID=A0ABS8Y488_9BURK|nr:tetratricopeptide repeat protein [Pelomonas sp. P8]MCE4556935.1 tetratricopeptide repeat protein [Pelomonas sp. P8]
MGGEATYPLRQALRLTGLTPRFLARLVEQGLLGSAGGQRFSHQDVVVGRTAHALHAAGVPPRKVLQALRQVKASLTEAPLSGVRLRPHAGGVALHLADRRLDAYTGQALLLFDDEPDAAAVEPLRAATERDAADWLHEAVRLEASDTAAAEAAYRRVLAMEVCCAAAYINLGALLCEAQRCEEAVALYEQALDHCEPSALIHFNRATALEDVGRPHQAVAAYERALALDPALADAHFNLGVLLDKLGDHPGSLRHLNAYRRAGA